MHPRHRHPRGSVALVALCFVAVMGIALASYLAVSKQAMKLSNRTFQTGVSEQLAEAGLEEALRAFNSNNWSTWTSGGTTATWSTSGTTANGTITFPASRFSPGVTGSVSIRVDNYNAASLPATWSATANYRINDLVGSGGAPGGVWYRCVQNGNLNKNPSTQTDLSWWVPAPIPWAWSSNTNYTANYDVVCSGGIWYRCITTHTSALPFAVGANWSAIPAPALVWSNLTAYAVGAFVFNNGAWYRCILAHTNHVPPNVTYWSTGSPFISWAWRSGVAYAFNDLVFYSASGAGTWYRCITPHTSGASFAGANWENALSGSWAWSSTDAYNLNDVIYSGTSFYRCILAHTNHAPPNATYWSNAPRLSTAWDAGRQYNANDTVWYEGVWYLSQTGISNIGQNPSASASTYWWSTANAGTQWNAATSYAIGNYCSYSGVWYQCLSAGAGKSPNNSANWAAAGAPVIYAQGSATLPDGSASIKTQLRAPIAPAPLFPNALAAGTTLQIGGGGTIDSYDSVTDPTASLLGYSAVLSAGYAAGTAITITSTAVQGYVAAPSSSTMPFAPLFSSGGSLKGPSSPVSPNIDLTRISRSPYIPQFAPLPAGGLAAAFTAGNFCQGTALALAATVNIGTPGAVTPSRYYYDGDLSIGLASPLTYLNINGPVILYINGSLIMDGGPNGIININSGGSAEIHIANSLTVNIAADGIKNTTLDPKKLILICDTSASSTQNYSDGTNPVYGVLYLPNTTNASGLLIDNTNVLIYGAISARKIIYSGVNANLHYDTSLRYATFGGIDQPYAVTEWRELTGPVERATFP